MTDREKALVLIGIRNGAGSQLILDGREPDEDDDVYIGVAELLGISDTALEQARLETGQFLDEISTLVKRVASNGR